MLLTGGILLLYGVFAIVGFCRAETRTARAASLALLLGIVAAAVGAVLLLQPALFQSILTIILGIYILIDGLLNLMRALELRRMEHGGWTVHLVLSLITVALGLVVVFRPMLAGAALVQLIGASLVYSGAADLWTLFQRLPLDQGIPQRPTRRRWTRWIRNKPVPQNGPLMQLPASGGRFCFALLGHYHADLAALLGGAVIVHRQVVGEGQGQLQGPPCRLHP